MSLLSYSEPLKAINPSPADDLFDCTDFTYQEDAQLFLEEGDPNKLDPDGNGKACDQLPKQPDYTDIDYSDIFDCSDFMYREEAQEYLEPGDPHKLDPDGNGKACEKLPKEPDYNDYMDCSDFTYREEAQSFLEPGDPHKLDPDGNGKACENLPKEPDYSSDYDESDDSGYDLWDCSDFESQAEAELFLEPGDPSGLDADGDGIPCEELPAEPSYEDDYEYDDDYDSGGDYTSGGDRDCSDVSGPIYVGPNDPHGLDGDGDGIGCE